MRYERTFTISAIVLFVALNAGSLYFIIDLFSYDEIVCYLADGGIKSSDPHGFVYALLITTLFDILFVFTMLCSWFTKSK
ncbi:hypothetical protein [Flavobacterium lindanitolerans]|jgi:hypothetical protein|uniref:hypothetical protein n=1 Tax=Flavobacterium lindanitolerans TaxID=428988 RepID=UPI0012212C3F|nr:hypothetical protein [Flavobacterium lindanitolerans]THD34177.1 MAG: hypothetical protein DI588_03270 [Flavobacterium johnsoniae]